MKLLFEVRTRKQEWKTLPVLQWCSCILSGVTTRLRLDETPKEFLFRLRHMKAWRQYKTRVIDKNPLVDLYYNGKWNDLAVLAEPNHIEKVNMKSGQVAIMKLLKAHISGGSHLGSDWQCIGYEGEKPFDQMSFREFVKVTERGAI